MEGGAAPVRAEGTSESEEGGGFAGAQRRLGFFTFFSVERETGV
jgi:hypothetical protein